MMQIYLRSECGRIEAVEVGYDATVGDIRQLAGAVSGKVSRFLELVGEDGATWTQFCNETPLSDTGIGGEEVINIIENESAKAKEAAMKKFKKFLDSRTHSEIFRLAIVEEDIELLYAVADVFDTKKLPYDAVSLCVHHSTLLPVMNDIGLSFNCPGDPFKGTPLMIAASEDLVDVISQLIRFGADVNFSDRFKRTATTTAVTLGKVAALEVLASHGAKLQFESFFGNPLFIAAAAHHLHIIRKLHELGVPIDHRDNLGRTALHRLLEAGDVSCWGSALTLIELGASTSTVNSLQRTPLMKLAADGNVSMIRLLAPLVDVNFQSVFGSALQSAIHRCTHNRMDTVRCLLSHGADINTTDMYCTPLVHYSDDPVLTNYLLSQGASFRPRRVELFPFVVLAFILFEVFFVSFFGKYAAVMRSALIIILLSAINPVLRFSRKVYRNWRRVQTM